jgi:hypothetical protein
MGEMTMKQGKAGAEEDADREAGQWAREEYACVPHAVLRCPMSRGSLARTCSARSAAHP